METQPEGPTPDSTAATADTTSKPPQLNAIPAGKDPKRNYWKAEEERIIKDWADKAQCYEWMHLRAHIKYKSRNAWFTIPVIIISTITGTANFAQDRFSEDYKPWVVMGVGAFNIFAGIITTIYQFLKISELNEGHRVAALYWGKFYRNLRTELAKHPLDRSNHDHVLTGAKEEYDRLLEMSPMVPQSVIAEFNKKYGLMTGFTRPEIVTTQFGTEIFSMTDNERKQMVEDLLADKIAIERAKEAEMDKLKRELAETIIARDHEHHELENLVEKINHPSPPTPVSMESPELHRFKETFLTINGRYPTETEIQTLYKPIYSPDNSPARTEESLDLNLLPEVSHV